MPRAIWNVRSRPARVMASGVRPAISCPAKRTLPPSGRSTPLMHWKAVVLPAPLGPISAVMVPARTAKLAPRRACTPPKERVRPVTLSRTSASEAGN